MPPRKPSLSDNIPGGPAAKNSGAAAANDGSPPSSSALKLRQIRNAVREGRRVRDIVQDLPEKDALSLYEAAGLVRSGSSVRAFLDAKRPKFLSFLDTDRPLELVLVLWKNFHSGQPSEGRKAAMDQHVPADGDLEPFATTVRLHGWRKAALIWLMSTDVVADLPPQLARAFHRSIVQGDSLPAATIDRWHTWYRVGRVEEEAFGAWMHLSDSTVDTVGASLTTLVDEAAKDLSALKDSLDDGQLTDVSTHAAARATTLSRLATSARQLADKVDEVLDDVIATVDVVRKHLAGEPLLSGWSERLEVDAAHGIGIPDVLETLHQLEDACDDILLRLETETDRSAELQSVLDFVEKLPADMHRSGREQVHGEAATAKRQLDAGTAAATLLDESPILGALSSLLSSRKQEMLDKSALERLGDELPGRFVRELEQLLRTSTVSPTPPAVEPEDADPLAVAQPVPPPTSGLDTLQVSDAQPPREATAGLGSTNSADEAPEPEQTAPDVGTDCAEEDSPRPEVTPARDELDDHVTAESSDSMAGDDAVAIVEVESSAPALPQLPTSPPRLADGISSFDEFRERYWIGPSGSCEQAPWYEPQFATRLEQASSRALRNATFAELWVLSSAAARLGRTSLVAAKDVESFASLWSSPASATAGADATRPQRIREALGSEVSTDQLLACVCLEALRPNHESQLTLDEVQRVNALLGERMQNRDLQVVLAQMLTLGCLAQNPVGVAAASLSVVDQEESVSTREDALKRARAQFRQTAARLWSAAGGTVERTHCRKAWTQFIDSHVRPLTEVLYEKTGHGPSDTQSWNLDVLAASCRALAGQHAEIADRAKVKFLDRGRMDRAMREISDAAIAVVEAARRLRSPGPSLRGKRIQFPHGELERLVKAAPTPSHETEEFCRQLLTRVVFPPKDLRPDSETLSLGIRAALEHPEILGVIDTRTLVQTSGLIRLPVQGLTSPTRAAAILLSPPHDTAELGAADEEIVARLRTRLRDAGRFDLLARLLDLDVLDPAEKTAIHGAAAERAEELRSRLDRIRRLRSDIDELGLYETVALDAICRAANGILDEPTQQAGDTLPLLDAWLEKVEVYACEVLRQAVIRRLQDESTPMPGARHEVLEALQAHDLHSATEWLRSVRSGESSSRAQSERTTLWRAEARRLFDAPRSPLLGLSSTKPELKELIRLWHGRASDSTSQQKLRKAFWRLVSGEENDSGGNTALRKIRPTRDICIYTDELRARLKREGLNPTFLPQLRSYNEVVIAIAPTLRPDQISRDLPRAASENGQRCLSVFLAPALGEQARSQCLSQLRSRHLSIAVIDDVDLYRLAAPQASSSDGFIALLEVVLEQLDLGLVSPFRSHDGQFVQEESFVGRDSYVEELASTSVFSRVFSGRKLGKSALLKYIELTRDGKPLPSGNTLRVLDISVAGGDSEASLVASIRGALDQRLGFRPLKPNIEDPGETLTAWMEEFRTTRPKESLLVILDEADAFVEGQLGEYDRVRERCLSFRMMKAISDETDSAGLPRTRFVFSGYRVTNTRDGAWANAGNVLRLQPLREPEATRFIEGSLCRIGIDARQQAGSIARRCGLQPAVLIRFGERLLNRMQMKGSSARRDSLAVLQEDVVATFNDPAVQEEIRTVVNNNFQGNRSASIIFSALLLIFKDLGPGEALEDAPQRILDQIRAIDPDTEWLRKVADSETSEIQHVLSDLVDRELLVPDGRDGRMRYRLRFPHHLPVLAQTDLPNAIRKPIAALRQGVEDFSYQSNLLPPAAMNALRRILHEPVDPELPLIAGVVGTSWLSGVQDPRGGIPDRLGISPDEITDLANGHLDESVVARPRLVAINVSARTAASLVERRPRELRPPVLIGGLDLLRWASRAHHVALDALIETCGLGRLSQRQIAWWFERLRNLQFTPLDAIQQIESRTSGIPLLVGAIDEELSSIASGGEVGKEALEHALARMEERLPEIVRSLRGGGTTGLEPREIELLGLIGHAVEYGDHLHLRNDLADQSLLDSVMPGVAAFGREADDDVAADVLKLSGLLPLQDDGTIRLKGGDGLRRILSSFDAT